MFFLFVCFQNYAAFRFVEPDTHTNAVCSKWVVTPTECFYPMVTGYKKARELVTSQAQVHDKTLDVTWDLFDGILLIDKSKCFLGLCLISL
jgi:hypothetical protein